jgi:hypothetical protein
MYALGIVVDCCHLDWQVSSMAQISNSLSQMFSAVEHLTLEHEVHSQSSEEHNEVDRTEWRKLLRPFSNVKTLRIENGLVKDLSRCLELEDGELPLELLPELQEPHLPPSLIDKTTAKIRIGFVPGSLSTMCFPPITYHMVSQWPGYAPSEHQVQLRDQTPTKNPIGFDRFVKHVGSRVRQFLMVRLFSMWR